MKLIDVTTLIRHPNGTPLKETPDEFDEKGVMIKEGELMTVAHVLVRAALQPSQKAEGYTPYQQVIRYQLSLDAWKAKENAEDPTMRVSPRAMKEIADDISRVFTPVVGGQILLMLGYRIPDEDEDENEEEPLGERMSPEMRSKLRPLARAQK